MPQIKKVKNTWTQVPNTWLKDKNLSLKAKGLLAVMQSLPDNWEFSIRGLASILKEGVEAVQSALQEIENAGYLTRTPTKDEKGFFSKAEYILHENPSTENQYTEKPAQYNTKIQNTKERERGTPASPLGRTEQIQQESDFSFPGGKSGQSDAETVNGNPFEKQSIYDAVGTTQSIIQENERKRKQIELSEVCLDVAAEFGDTRLARNKKLRPRIAALLAVGYTRWDIVRVAHNWHNLKDKQGRLFGFGIFSDAMFPTLLKQEPKPEIWTR